MTHVTYEIVEHDGGWAYKLGDVLSEPSQRGRRRWRRQRWWRRADLPGPTETIEYQDEEGRWHEERASGDDRPETEVRA